MRSGDVRKWNCEIGRILHLKSEVRSLKLDFIPSAKQKSRGLNKFKLRFRISDLRCRIRPISQFHLASVLLLLLLFTSYSTVAQGPSVHLPPFSKFELKNGMTVLLMEQHELPLVSMNIIVKQAWSIGDPKAGVASLTADLLRKGTRTRTSEQISSELDFLGGQFEMSASADFSSATAEFLKKDIRAGLELVSDILMKPVFPPDELAKARSQRVASIKTAKDRAERVISRYFLSYLYGQHAYARPVDGDEQSLPTITREDVRKFYDDHYVPSNVILAVAGDFATPEMRSLIEQYFGSWTQTKTMVSDPALLLRPVQGRRLLLVDKPDSTQTYFYIGNLGVSRTNPDRIAISVVNSIFGGRFTSRLNEALRVDSGLTYGAYSVFDERLYAGPFMITSYTRNATTEKAIDMALEVLSKFHEKGLTRAELDSTKAYMKGQFPPTIETTDRLASTIARLEFYRLDESEINSYFEKIDAVTVGDAERIIKQYFPLDDLVFVLIGKASEIQNVAKKYAPIMDMKKIDEPGF